jgi:AraC family transcriptional regulator
MSNVELMSQAVDYIEGNLKEPITVADMAAAVSFSLYHFCRTFNQITHHTPYDYLMRRRLSESAHDLVHTDRKIIEIACDYQFNNPETFSRAFRRMFDVQPNQARKQGSVDPCCALPPLTSAHLEHMARSASLTPALEEKDMLRVAGVMTLVKPGQDLIPELWEWLAQELQGRDLPRKCYGLRHYPKDWEQRGFWYMAGVEMPASGEVGTALAVKTLPPLKYARFTHTGPPSDVPLTLDYVFHTWLPKSGQRWTWPLVVVEHYGHDLSDRESDESETRIYIPIQDNPS